MTERVFADTNVWVYLVDRDEATRQGMARAILAPRAGVQQVISAQVMSEFYVNATRKLTRPVSVDLADRIVERMARLEVVPLDAGLVYAAISGARAWRISYWDALIVVAAQAGGCRRLLSEDLADGATYGTVRVENPFRERPRASETSASYEPRAARWTDDDLVVELERYEQACRDAGMRPNAIHSYWDYARRFLAWRTGDYRPRRAAATDRPVPVAAVDAQSLQTQVAAYVAALQAAGLEAVTVDTYERHAAFFVRWLDGRFRPGGRLDYRRQRSAGRTSRT